MSKWLTLIISLLILAALFFDAAFKSSQAKPVLCQSLWGPAQVMEPGHCRLEVPPSTEPSLIQIPLDKPGFLTGENIVLQLRGAQLVALRGLEVRLKSQGQTVGTYALPLFAESTQNLLQEDWSIPLSLNLSSLQGVESDRVSMAIDQLELYLVSSEAARLQLQVESVWWEKKPQKGRISLTFDDGYEEHQWAASVMAAQGLRGTAYLIPEAIGSPHYLNHQQVQELKTRGWDLASHLVTPVTAVESEALIQALSQATNQLKALGSDGAETHFAYPLGQYSQSSLATLSDFMQSARLAGGGVESLPPLDILRLRAVNVTPNLSADELIAMATKAVENGDWLILMFHYLDQTDKGELSYPKAEFQKLTDGLAPLQRYVQPVRLVIESL